MSLTIPKKLKRELYSDEQMLRYFKRLEASIVRRWHLVRVVTDEPVSQALQVMSVQFDYASDGIIVRVRK